MPPTFSVVTSYTSRDAPIATTKLHRRSQHQQRPAGEPRRGTKMIRSMRDWFGMCWGRGRSEDGESVGERQRLIDYGKVESWDSDEETECEDEDEGEDERLIGVKQDGKTGVVGECKEGKRWKGIWRDVSGKCTRWS